MLLWKTFDKRNAKLKKENMRVHYCRLPPYTLLMSRTDYLKVSLAMICDTKFLLRVTHKHTQPKQVDS